MLSQRRVFVDELLKWMEIDESIFVLTGDLGYLMWDQIRQKYPKRFVNTGASEQTLLDMAVGLAQSQKKPFVYSITPFLLWRAAETIRTYINHESTPVRLVGGGRNKDYSHDGFSHDASDDKALMKLFTNIKSFWPDTDQEVIDLTEKMVKIDQPWYLNLRR